MSKQSDALKARMSGAGGNRATGTAPKLAAVMRTKHRITLDLDHMTFTDLDKWVGATSAELGGRVTLAEALRAMITVIVTDGGMASTGAASTEVREQIRQART